MKQLIQQNAENRIKNSNYSNYYAYLNFRLGFGFPKQTWITKNRFYPTMHHSVMSYEDISICVFEKYIFSLKMPIFLLPKLHFVQLNDFGKLA